MSLDMHNLLKIWQSGTLAQMLKVMWLAERYYREIHVLKAITILLSMYLSNNILKLHRWFIDHV